MATLAHGHSKRRSRLREELDKSGIAGQLGPSRHPPQKKTLTVWKFDGENPGGVVAVTCPEPELVSTAFTLSLPGIMVTGVVMVAPGTVVLMPIDTGAKPPANC